MKSNASQLFCHLALLGLLAMVLQFVACRDEEEMPDPAPLTVDFTSSLSGDCPTPCQVCFTSNAPNATAYAWNFGNGQTSVEANPCVTYQTNGTFTVTLTASRGTETRTISKTVVVADNIERYRRTFSVNSAGIVTNLLIKNGFTYALMTVDGVKRFVRFNADSEIQRDIGIDQTVTNLAPREPGGFFVTGSFNNNACVAEYTDDLWLTYLQEYPSSRPSVANSIVHKYTGDVWGRIVCGNLEDNWSNDQGLLINTDELGNLYNPDVVAWSLKVNRIFRNAGEGLYTYVALGNWRDPIQQKMDIRVFSVNDQGVDYLPINLYIGLDNGKDDAIYDAIQYNNGTSYAAVGESGGESLFFITTYQNQNFTAPIIVKNFPNTVKRLTGICLLNDGNFVVAGTEFDTNFFGIFLAKIAPDGNVLWQKRLVPNANTVFGDIAATPDGGFIVGGQEFCSGTFCPPFPVLYKTDANGNFQ